MLFKNYKQIAPLAVAIAIIGGVLGIALSYHAEVPSGPAIIFVLTIMFLTIKLLSLYFKHLQRRR
jgi:zinc transport system permease protein